MQVIVVEHRREWSELFNSERSLLLNFLGGLVDNIHHIGSTSVQGLAAKPIIDILIQAKSLDALDGQNSEFEAHGYEVMGEFGIKGRRYYRKGGDRRTHQIHAFKTGDHNILRHIAFRDYLAEHPSVKAEYQKLKIGLAETCNHNIDKYCDGKEEFGNLHEKKAIRWVASK